MYKIDTANVTEYLENVQFVCKQPNGVIALCQQDQAQGFLKGDASIIYAMEGGGLENDYEVAALTELSMEQYGKELTAPIAAENEELKGKVQMLEDCLMEMSETVYA